MQKPTKDTVEREIKNALEHLDILQKQSLNRFDTQEIYQRAFQLIDTLETKVAELNHFFNEPSPEVNRHLQDLFFNVKKLRETAENLKNDPQKLSFQNALISGVDAIKEDLTHLGDTD